MGLVELKTGDRPVKINELLKSEAKLSNVVSPIVYVNDRRINEFSRNIRPRSKVIVFDKDPSALPQDDCDCRPSEWIAPKARGSYEPRVAGSEGSLNIAFENNRIVIINKPCGLPTQQTMRGGEDNLFDQVREHFARQKNFPMGLPYVGLHHRLDRSTSGLVLMTKQRSVNKEVAELFKNRQIRKTYLAFVEWRDKQPPQQWTERNRIGKIPHKRHHFYFGVTDKGDEAITDFKLLESVEGKGHLLACFPKTGRTHQIRVHLAHAGWPILGDHTYGDKRKASRMMLHAKSLEFQLSGDQLKVNCEPDWSIS